MQIAIMGLLVGPGSVNPAKVLKMFTEQRWVKSLGELKIVQSILQDVARYADLSRPMHVDKAYLEMADANRHRQS